MKTLLLTAAIAGAIGAGAAHYWPSTLGGPNGLKCELTETTIHGGNGTEPRPEIKNSTWLIRLAGDQWELVSIDGMSMAELARQDKKDGKDDKKALPLMPLRVSAQTYVLMEGKIQDASGFSSSPMMVDRTTGQISCQSAYWPKDSGWHTQTTDSGHCEPFRVHANL